MNTSFFWARVHKTETCWLWKGVKKDGYGRYWFSGKYVRAHRFSWEIHVGEVPKNLVLDHLCRVRHCVNPAHLEPVTRAENNRRGALSFNLTGMCRRGHIIDGPETLYVPPSGRRECLACIRERMSKRDRRKHV